MKKDDILSEAMKAAGKPVEGDDAGQALSIQEQGEEAVGGALAQPVAIFSIHSNALRGEVQAKFDSYVALANDLDRKIAELQAERENVMLCCSGLSALLTALAK